MTAPEPAKRTTAPRDGVWLAHGVGGAGEPVAVFSTRLAALEFAVERGLKVRRVTYGEDLRGGGAE